MLFRMSAIHSVFLSHRRKKINEHHIPIDDQCKKMVKVCAEDSPLNRNVLT